MVGWDWVYEPLDLYGWIPDFSIRTTGKPLLIEVKPVTELPADIVAEIARATYRMEYETMIVGLAPFAVDGLPYLGWIQDRSEVEPGAWDRASVGTILGDQLCLSHASASHRCPICGADEGWGASMPMDELLAAWATACNRTQWKAAA